jgi:hypothetical protein
VSNTSGIVDQLSDFESGLINQVTAAANSQAAMDAIIDNRA